MKASPTTYDIYVIIDCISNRFFVRRCECCPFFSSVCRRVYNRAMAESEGRVIEEINLADDDQNEVECLEDLVTLDCPHDDMMDSSQESQDDIVDITPPPEV